MPTRPLERLLFAQGGRCFFCDDVLDPAEASVEHLVATVNGGGNDAENCVACCKSLNHLLGRMSLKEKLRVVLNQEGRFKCPNGGTGTAPPAKARRENAGADRLEQAISHLRKLKAARPATVKTLSSTLHALFQKKLAAVEVESLLADLQSRGVVTVNGTKVAYALPTQGAPKKK